MIQPGKCVWIQDPYYGTWQTSCGREWEFVDGGPKENDCRYCHQCGKPIVVETFQDEEEETEEQ